jgi:hypothetical protein
MNQLAHRHKSPLGFVTDCRGSHPVCEARRLRSDKTSAAAHAFPFADLSRPRFDCSPFRPGSLSAKAPGQTHRLTIASLVRRTRS